MQVFEKTSPRLSKRLPSGSFPRGTGLLGLMLPARIPVPSGDGTPRAAAGLRVGRSSAQSWCKRQEQIHNSQRSSTDSISSGSAGLAMKETQVQHFFQRESKEGQALGTRCQAQGEHKSSSVQKLDSQPVEEVLEPNSTPGDPRTPAFLPQSPRNLPSWVGNGGPEGSTASMAAPATRHGSI